MSDHCTAQLVSQSVGQQKILLKKKQFKIHINLVEGLMIDLETFLSLAITTYRCQKVDIKLVSG